MYALVWRCNCNLWWTGSFNNHSIASWWVWDNGGVQVLPKDSIQKIRYTKQRSLLCQKRNLKKQTWAWSFLIARARCGIELRLTKYNITSEKRTLIGLEKTFFTSKQNSKLPASAAGILKSQYLKMKSGELGWQQWGGCSYSGVELAKDQGRP